MASGPPLTLPPRNRAVLLLSGEKPLVTPGQDSDSSWRQHVLSLPARHPCRTARERELRVQGGRLLGANGGCAEGNR